MDFSAFKAAEPDGWTRRADIYAQETARATVQTIPKLLDHARLFPGARVLDAGCGPGFVAGVAKLLGAAVEGIDFAPGMVAEAQARFSKPSSSAAQ